MCMWLSGANSLANTARGKIAVEAKRQSAAAVIKATSDMVGIGTTAATAPAAVKRKKRR